MATAIAKQPIVFSFTAATGGQGGTEDGYDVVFTENDSAVWIEKTIFEAFFVPTATANGLSFGSAFELLKAGTSVERASHDGIKYLDSLFTADSNSMFDGGKTPKNELRSIKEVSIECPYVSKIAILSDGDLTASDYQVYGYGE